MEFVSLLPGYEEGNRRTLVFVAGPVMEHLLQVLGYAVLVDYLGRLGQTHSLLSSLTMHFPPEILGLAIRETLLHDYNHGNAVADVRALGEDQIPSASEICR